MPIIKAEKRDAASDAIVHEILPQHQHAQLQIMRPEGRWLIRHLSCTSRQERTENKIFNIFFSALQEIFIFFLDNLLNGSSTGTIGILHVSAAQRWIGSPWVTAESRNTSCWAYSTVLGRDWAPGCVRFCPRLHTGTLKRAAMRGV